MRVDLKRRLQGFYKTLADRPLEPDDPVYVPFLSEANGHGDGDPISALTTRISWSEAASVHLLSGQRGSGKSTELRRLRKALQEEDCEVFLCDMGDYMNQTMPVEVSDFFMSMMGALSDAVQARYKKDLTRESYWTRLVHLLGTELQIKEMKLEASAGAGKAGLSLALKDDPSFKKSLQGHLRGHIARLVQHAHEFATEVVTRVREYSGNADKKVVLLLDSIEKIRGVGADADDVYKSVENLFSGHAERLHLPLLHVVYTIPPFLPALAPGIGRLLGGGTICSLPSIHIRTREGQPDPRGVGIMQRIVTRRYQAWQEFLTPQQLERLALVTGGDLRDFFRIVGECLVNATSLPDSTLPLDEVALQNAENHLRREMLPIAAEDATWLRRIANSKKSELETLHALPRLARFFDTHVVLNYRNGDDWYDIHPLLYNEICGGQA